jgi:integrase
VGGFTQARPLPAYQSLQTVEGLRAGRSQAKERPPVQPVPEAFVRATLPYLTPQVAAMAELQLLTGMRGGEVTAMRTMDLETGGKLWLYRPGSDRGPAGKHKTSYRGRSRVVFIGPRAQEILRPWLRLNLAEHLFQPREARAHWEAEKRKARRTPVQPSQVCRRKARPKKVPGERYAVASYDRAIAKAVLVANRDRACDPCKGRPPADRCDECKAAAVPHWHPHQLRHTKATEIRREAGLDAARAVLGHSTPVVTAIYAEADMNKAAEVMARLG